MKYSTPPRLAQHAGKKTMCLLFVLAAFSLSSCFSHYYKTNTEQTTDSERLQRLVNEKKYFILHRGNQYFGINNIRIENDQLNGDIEYLPAIHQKHLHPKKETRNRFHAMYSNIVKFEVHLYTNDSLKDVAHISIPVKDFYQMDVYELDKEATEQARVLSIIGITVGVAAAVVVIVSTVNAINNLGSGDSWNTGNGSSGTETSTCSPQLYNSDGVTKSLTGILFSGAVFAPLQRTDYMPLPAPSAGNQYHLQIKGGANEYLYIKQAKLLQVQHKANDRVLVDCHGNVLLYAAPLPPYNASTGETQEIKKTISIRDEKYYSFTNAVPGQQSSTLILDFKKPAGAGSGRLILTARNTAWALYVFKKYKSLYGENYTMLSSIKDKADPQKLMQCELDQSLPLLVSIKTRDGWKPADYFLTPGNLAARDMIMEIDLSDNKDSDHVELKLETAFMFWEIDYAAMDFSGQHSFTATGISPYNLVKQGQSEQLVNQTNQDIMLNDDEELNVDFLQDKNMPGMISSCFFVGSGYYHDKTQYKGKPDAQTLAAFSQKGSFDKFSRQSFGILQSACRKNNAVMMDLSAKQ